MQTKSNKATALRHILLGGSESHSKQWLIFLNIILIIILLAAITPAYAQPMEDKFKISLGGYVLTRYKSSMSLTEKNAGVGVSFSPQDTLGLETKNTAVFRLDGHFRFNKRNALTFSWYKISRDGHRIIEQNIDWVDENGNPINIPVGARVDTSLDYDIYKLSYLWSFYSSDKVDLVIGAGFHTTRIAVGVTSDTTSTGIQAKSVKSTVPLPVLSFGLTYRVTPKFKWYLKSESLSLAFGDWDGTYSDNTAGMEYKLFRHLGLGLGIGNNSLNLTVEGNDYRFDFNNRITGILAYVSGEF
jgi:hypothetical protein